jgi:hypothetical protein
MLNLTWMTPVRTNQSIEVHITHPHTQIPAMHLQSTFATLPDQTSPNPTPATFQYTFSVKLQCTAHQN